MLYSVGSTGHCLSGSYMAFAPFIPKAVRRLSLLGLITLSIYYVRFGLDAHQGGWARIGLIVAGTLEALCFIREVGGSCTDS